MARVFNIITSEGQGSIAIDGDEVVMDFGRKIKTKKSYLSTVEKMEALPMARVRVKLNYYDAFGSPEQKEFAMNETEFRALKQLTQQK
ncbi:MAG: hypothetical protein V1834_04260 [Candidatus Micrarchaeota archaeon]